MIARRECLILIVAVATAIALSPVAADAGAESGSRYDPVVAWTADVTPWTGPQSISDATYHWTSVYLVGEEGLMVSVDGCESDTLWVVDASPWPGDQRLLAVTNDGTDAFAVGAEGLMSRVDLQSGTVVDVWDASPWEGQQSLEAVLGSAYCAGAEGRLAHVSKYTGDVDWEIDASPWAGAQALHALASSGSYVYCVGAEGRMSKIRTSNHEVVWEVDASPWPGQQALYCAWHSGSSVFCAGAEGRLASISASDGSVQWSKDVSPWAGDQAIYDFAHGYYGDYSHFYCVGSEGYMSIVSLSDGTVDWHGNITPWSGSQSLAAIVGGAGFVYAVGAEGVMSAVQTASESLAGYAWPESIGMYVSWIGDCCPDVFYYTNVGCDRLSGPVFSGCPEFSVSPDYYEIDRFESQLFSVEYCPHDCGDDFYCQVFIYPLLYEVLANGCGPNEPDCSVSPSSLVFDVDSVGGSDTKSFQIRNTECGVLSGSVWCSHDEFTVAPQSYSLWPSQSKQFTVTYTPDDCGSDACTIETSYPCWGVSCSAAGPTTPVCSVEPDTLWFEVPADGGYDEATFVISNVGCGLLSGAIYEDCMQFEVDPSEYALAPGESQEHTVSFVSPAGCADLCIIDIGADGRTVVCHGDTTEATPVEFAFYADAAAPNEVRLRWSLGSDGDLDGLNLYRSLDSGGPFERVNDSVLESPGPCTYTDGTVWPETTFWYELRGVTALGSEIGLGDGPVSVVTPGTLLGRLHPPCPSPFRAATSVTFDVPESAQSVSLAVHDASGRLVKQLAHGSMGRGRYEMPWDGTDRTGTRAASGVYFVRYEIGDWVSVEKVLFLK